ncbi:Peroxiredoxin [Pelagirhabdus alkalitolerans]|uniref:Peroxiredoxin n=1 Tax=Pelagirhabdus alkalitolerans TaxID=1612202 RepID=A0A1G6KM52_9BACI|nr:redoxin domain-containing protein [Pelagirhabdus alkalitolerans]SDC32159.1 Peroxiredoxin [Pelagirhabdus alkalitolerans]
MKKWIIMAVLLGLFGWAVYDFLDEGDDVTADDFEVTDETDLEGDGAIDSDSIGLNIGDTAPNFELETLSGDTIQLSDYRGERVMLNFWGTWCPPCRAEMPDMQRFYENEDVEILAVNLTTTESSRQDVDDFIEDFELTFTIPMDDTNDIAMLYEIRPVPTTFMIDSNGVIQHKALGALNYEQMVESLSVME